MGQFYLPTSLTMQASNNTPPTTQSDTQPDTPAAHDLAKLSEKVNALLDTPLPKEGDAWPLTAEASLAVDDAEPKELPRAGAT